MNEMTTLEWVYAQIERKEPPPEPPSREVFATDEAFVEAVVRYEKVYGPWCRLAKEAIIAELEQSGASVTLQKAGGNETRLAPSELRHIDAERLRLGAFDLWFSGPIAWRGWDGATIWLPVTAAKRSLTAALKAFREGRESKNGRPRKPSHEQIRAEYRATFPEGHVVKGLTWEKARRACPSAASYREGSFKRIVKTSSS